MFFQQLFVSLDGLPAHVERLGILPEIPVQPGELGIGDGHANSIPQFVGAASNQPAPNLQGLLVCLNCLVGGADFSGYLPHARISGSQIGLQRWIILAVLMDELLIVLQRQLQQLLAQRLQ